VGKLFCNLPGAILGVVIHYDDLVVAALHYFLKLSNDDGKVFSFATGRNDYREIEVRLATDRRRRKN
jgi:hypothetical protein